ncbi:uncharacterized protein L3040_004844 [Drepanopeziza brunnea f. sp. 'multigermtubi']|uniref:Glycosyltransferase 2 n=1 Tax=Marssonina brunnea f. sp. multigermtubi (strain MB_m1) TaxID=1072389 RepID=K1WVH4_MARBU|nr:glycosyltransferase 2 [Drepanopeziza brunnea f. sp. 'multigermtubi' MB_m1]EKD21620.1 glycosyltransferase 2 [Drepanopeziza brunnea f. sp. 'multigermtubi' MB_m1]KAJ5042292.1 hypothetical protein L3040_004844 [Drepanopeziza brunnea f. sp. 'multigermtubi']
MPLVPRLFPGDVELGKRDDDHKPGGKSQLGLAWQHRRIPNTPLRRSMKRMVLGVLALIALYYFFRNMPTDLENPRKRPSYVHAAGPYAPSSKELPVSKATASEGGQSNTTDVPLHDFNGPIKFYNLASTLHGADILGSKGYEQINSNVLFAAASLKSAAILLPIACEMAIRRRNYVHFALLGRDDISMDILKSVNGISQECNIIFHDARPDFSVQSSDFRMEVSTVAAFNHINAYIHPQATILDGSGEEESWFLKSLGDRVVSLGRTVIELPENAEKNLMWITLLDSSSLRAWNQVSIDIIVHAQPAASGALIRLLRSLRKADFFSSALPRLTIELPHDIDESSRQFLEGFHWPPVSSHNTGNLLTLHHRIPQHGLTAEENSIRFLESFWPANPLDNHVLVLSPNVELSPLFFHYLKYTMLEYVYSASSEDLRQNLLGISLDLPSVYLNDSTPFTAPLANASEDEDNVAAGATHFLWEAPNSNAELYFGDKWIELHDFVSQSLSSQHTLPTPTTLNEKIVSKTYPSWLEHVLRLVRNRGYWTIYPTFGNDYVLATLHQDLYQAPEEFKEEVEAEAEMSEELGADPSEYLSLKQKERDSLLIQTSLLNILPSGGDLPKLSTMPIVAWDGTIADVDVIAARAENYSSVFRREIGGCDEDSVKEVVGMFAGDLFCLNDPKK